MYLGPIGDQVKMNNMELFDGESPGKGSLALLTTLD
jgi:hypothetical protein